jgi:dolichol kinase
MDPTYRAEVARKAIHLCSLSIPIIYFFIPRSTALLIAMPVMIAFVAVDLARYVSRPIQQWYHTVFGWLLREHEAHERTLHLNGASYVLISATLCILIFPKLIAVMSFSVLIISDLSAALIGRRYGSHRFLGKSLEGSLSFFLSGVAVILATPKIGHEPLEYAIGIAAVAIGACVEALSVTIDDNLTIPLSVGFSIWAGYALLLPALNIYHFG